MRRGWAAGALTAGALLAAGCSDNTPGDLTVAGARVLQPEVQHVRDIAATGTFAELQAAVKHLKSLVEREKAQGQVSASRAGAIEDAADVLLTDAQSQQSPSPTPTTESPTPSPTPTTESPTPSPTPTTAAPTPTSSPSPSGGVTVSVSP